MKLDPIEAEARLRRAIQDPAAAQAELLAVILRRHADTEFGRAHRFGSIKDLAEYRRRVPMASYADFAPAVDRMMDGAADVLFAGQPVFISRTSGTSAKSKSIPFSDQVEGEYRLFSGAMQGAIERETPGLFDRGMAILGTYREGQTRSGVVVGSASGFARHISRGIRHFEALPMEVTEETAHAVRYHAILLIALATPLQMLHALNPSTLISLFRYATENGAALADDLERGACVAAPSGVDGLLARAGHALQPRPELARRLRQMLAGGGTFSPCEMWPELRMLLTWQGGNTRHYLDQLVELCPGCTLRPTVSGSSEAALLVPLERSWTGGVPAILSTVMEFLPSDVEPSDDAIVDITQLEVDQGYRFCVTNQRGMYRLLMDDVFYVEGHHAGTPVLRFAARIATSSLTGEKLTEEQVLEGIARAVRETGVDLSDYQLVPEWGDPARYVLLVEQSGQASPRPALADLLAAFERGLRQLNLEYDAKRRSGRLGSPRLRLLERGDLARTVQQVLAGRSDAQAKIARLLLQPVDADPSRMRDDIQLPQVQADGSTT